MDDSEVDIADIGAEAFEACQRLVKDVSAGGFSAALTIFGDSGTGKTHLIGRVRRWLETRPESLFIFVRMETSPAGIWRHLRRSLALALMRQNANGLRAMDRLLISRKSDLENLPDRDLSIVLENLLEGRHVRDSSAWLRGEGLPEEALGKLGLAAPSPDEETEVSSRHFVTAICELIRPGAAVFCLDQLEAMMSPPDDRDGPHAFGKVVSFLVDETNNAAVISCQQSSFINLLEKVLGDHTKSRLMGRRAAIHPLSWEQAQLLIRARLDTAQELEGERERQGGCWPLAESQIRTVFVDNAAPARKVISRCKDLFDLWLSGKAVEPEPLDQALQEMLDERYKSKSPDETEAVLRNGIPLLARMAGMKCAAPGGRSPMDFTLGEGAVTVAIVNDSNMTALASRLKKIRGGWKPAPNQRLVLLRDARSPISTLAKATRQRLAELDGEGGSLLTVSQEAVEALAAMQRLLSDAKSGDLAHLGEAVSAGEVERWLTENRPAALETLVSDLEPAAGRGHDPGPALAALLAERKMVTLKEAAGSLEVEPGELEECARRDPRQFGFLGGGVPVLFQPVPSTERR